MGGALVWSFDAITGINWLEVIKALAGGTRGRPVVSNQAQVAGSEGADIQVQWLREMSKCSCYAHMAFRQDRSVHGCYRVADVELGTPESAKALERRDGNRHGRNTQERPREQCC